MRHTKPEPGERSPIAFVLALALVAGSVDSVSYLQLGKIFVAHMSGNSAAAGSDLARGDSAATLHRMLPIAGFIVALVAAAALSAFIVRARLRAPHALLFGLESVLLASAVGVAAIAGATTSASIVVGLTTAAMARQSAAVSRITGVPVRTTAITGVLTNFAEELVASASSRRSVPQRRQSFARATLHFAIWICFCLGAVAGGLATVRIGIAALVAPVSVLVALSARDLWRPLGASPPNL